MNSIRSARLVVVAEEVGGHALVDGLLRLGLAHVRRVTDLAAARHCCEVGEADACLVVLPCFLLEERAASVLAVEAPGRSSGIPSLLVADVATPYVRKAARRSGHAGVVTQNVPSRLMYRRIAGVLQRARRTRAGQPSQMQIRFRKPDESRFSGPILLHGLRAFARAADLRKFKLQ
jgi:hypothetical protein